MNQGRPIRRVLQYVEVFYFAPTPAALQEVFTRAASAGLSLTESSVRIRIHEDEATILVSQEAAG